MRKKMWVLLLFFVILLLGLNQTDSINEFVESIKNGSTSMALTDPYSMDDSSFPVLEQTQSRDHQKILLDTIKAEAQKRHAAPIDAKLDHVWKAIPGYNGQEVDIEKTYYLAKQKPSLENIPYVMKEIPPRIKLEDLGPNPIYKGNPNKPMVSLMINVAWGDEYIPSILETLKKENVHVTFFFDGSWLKKHIETAKEIARQGHELSNHGYSHKNMSQLSRQQAIQEIVKTEELLSGELGVKNTLFAPPSGDFDQETVQIASELKLKTILWTLDTVDWMNPGANQIIQKISKRVEPGSTILMHPTVSSSQALEAMIRIIKRKGLTLGTVSELLSPQRIPEPSIGS